MYSTKIRLHTIEEMNIFQNDLKLFQSQIDANIGNYGVDAHSLLGLMYISSLNKTIIVTINEICPKELENFKNIVKKYEVME